MVYAYYLLLFVLDWCSSGGRVGGDMELVMRDKIRAFTLGFLLVDLMILVFTLFPFNSAGVARVLVSMIVAGIVYRLTIPRYHGKLQHPEFQ